jgi:DNA-binding transcriptional ArsR family regulator
MTEKGPPTAEERHDVLTRTMAHPLRTRLLASLVERPGVSIRELGARLDEPERRVRYHLEAMVREDLVEVTRREIRRGGMEYFYSARVRPVVEEYDPSVVDIERQRQIAIHVLRLVIDNATAAIRSQRFGVRPSHCTVRHWGELDDAGWEEIAAIHQQSMEDVQNAFAKARERLDSRGEEGTPATSATLFFETDPWFPDEEDAEERSVD